MHCCKCNVVTAPPIGTPIGPPISDGFAWPKRQDQQGPLNGPYVTVGFDKLMAKTYTNMPEYVDDEIIMNEQDENEMISAKLKDMTMTESEIQS